MNIAVRSAMTVQDYLAWAQSPGEHPRSELINGQVVAMSPERAAHNRTKISVLMSLHRAIGVAGAQCEVLTDGMAVRIDDHTVYEPDALVYCGERLPPGSLIVPSPAIVVEVSSPSTVHTDTSAKLVGYFKLVSVQHYLVIDPDGRTVTHHARGCPPVVRSEGELCLDPPGLTVTIADLLGPV
jgi:Uma2 family endonuclease